MKGKFVTIEGCEGVGKSTLITLLKKYVQDNNIDAVFTREPGGTPVAEKIRAVILDADNKAMTDRAELLLYAAARAQHTQEKIIPAVSEGKIVFCDRYSDSTLAYQGASIDYAWVRALNIGCPAIRCPDLCIFLDLTPEVSMARISKGRESTEIFENVETLTKVRDSFMKVIDDLGAVERIKVIDASADIDTVALRILDEVVNEK